MQVPLTTLQVYNSPKANYDGIRSYPLDFDYSLSLQSQDIEFVLKLFILYCYVHMQTGICSLLCMLTKVQAKMHCEVWSIL